MPVHSPVGSYESDACTLTFARRGAFRYMKGDQLMVAGKYVVHDSTMSITDETGIDACVGPGRNPGTYRWKLAGAPCGSPRSMISARIEFADWLIRRGSRIGPAPRRRHLLHPDREASMRRQGQALDAIPPSD